MHQFKKTAIAVMMVTGLFSAQQVFAKTVKVTMTAMEVDLAVNNKGDVKMAAWTFDGSIPGKPVRVDEGDTVDFTLINPLKIKTHMQWTFMQLRLTC